MHPIVGTKGQSLMLRSCQIFEFWI